MTLRLADVKIGTEVPARAFRITRGDLVRYAGASGDFNLIHWNERVAHEVGLPDVIAHGMYTMALAVQVVTDWAGDPGAVLNYSVRMSRPVVVPDDEVGATLEIAGLVAAINEDGTVRVDLTATCAGVSVLARPQVTLRLRSA